GAQPLLKHAAHFQQFLIVVHDVHILALVVGADAHQNQFGVLVQAFGVLHVGDHGQIPAALDLGGVDHLKGAFLPVLVLQGQQVGGGVLQHFGCQLVCHSSVLRFRGVRPALFRLSIVYLFFSLPSSSIYFAGDVV